MLLGEVINKWRVKAELEYEWRAAEWEGEQTGGGKWGMGCGAGVVFLLKRQS